LEYREIAWAKLRVPASVLMGDQTKHSNSKKSRNCALRSSWG